MEDDKVAKRIQNKRTRIVTASKAHAKASKERAAKIKDVQAHFASIKDSPALADILEKCAKFQQYHFKLAQDGVGARLTGHKLVDGSDEVENFFLNNNQRAGHLDKSAGIQEIIDYINRQLNPPTPQKTKPADPDA